MCRHLTLALAAVLVCAGVLPATAAACGRDPEDAVRRYYRSIDQERFGAAWQCLSTATRTQFGGYRVWRSGYRDTLATRVTRNELVDQAAGLADVRVGLRVCTATSSGRVRRETLTGTWSALNGSAGWRLTDPAIRIVRRWSSTRC